MKKCPYCAEKIQDEEIVCPYCGRELSGSPSPAQKVEVVKTEKSQKRKYWIGLAVISFGLFAVALFGLLPSSISTHIILDLRLPLTLISVPLGRYS